MTSTTDYKLHAKTIVVMVLIIITAAAALISKSLVDFKQVETSWVEHTAKSNAITFEMANIRHHLGYGGFIHNFKNLVLRRDIAVYQPKIEQDISLVQQHLARLQKLLENKENLQALEQVQQTFIEYQSKYYLALNMLTQQANTDEIDSEVKVDDTKALQALQQLDQSISKQSAAIILDAKQLNSRARQFLLIASLLLLPVLLIAAIAIAWLLRRIIVVTNDVIVAEKELNNLLATSPDPTLSVNTSGLIIRVNKMAVAYFSQAEAALLGQPILALLQVGSAQNQPADYMQYINRLVRKQNNGEQVIASTIVDGEVRSVEIKLADTTTSNVTITTLTLRDVTEQLQLREALIKAKEEAEQNLMRQKAMQDELVQAEKMAALGKLVAGVAHEINTPVGTILTAASHLQNESAATADKLAHETLSAKQLSAYLQIAVDSSGLISHCCSRAAELIQSFKLVAVDQTGALKRQFDMAKYLNEVILSLRPSFKDRQITINVSCPPDIIMDSYPGAIAQVLTNLILNSLKHGFTDDDVGNIEVKLNLMEQPTDWLELVYEDNGAGIPNELQSEVFNPFFTTGRNRGFSGLGLHIVYLNITQLLAGSIAMSSTPGQGTCYIIRIPIAVPTDIAAQPPHAIT